MISQVRYFRCPVADVDWDQAKFFLSPHLAKFTNAKQIAQVGDIAILSLLIGPETANHIYESTGVTNVFTLDAVVALGLEDYYIGETVADVIALYPELEGQEQVGVDEDGNPVMQDKIKVVKWQGI